MFLKDDPGVFEWLLELSFEFPEGFCLEGLEDLSDLILGPRFPHLAQYFVLISDLF
jgi:hypothetical protein